MTRGLRANSLDACVHIHGKVVHDLVALVVDTQTMVEKPPGHVNSSSSSPDMSSRVPLRITVEFAGIRYYISRSKYAPLRVPVRSR